MNFDDIIELLLQKKANLRDEIEREFAVRSAKIEELLTAAGYEPPVEQPEAVEDVVENAPEQSADEAVAETVADAPVNAQIVY